MALLVAVALTVSAPAGAAVHCTRFDKHLRHVAPGVLETRLDCLLRGSQQTQPGARLDDFPPRDCDYFKQCLSGTTKVSAFLGAPCQGRTPYVQAGVNHTVPRFDATLQWPLVVVSAVAAETVPYQFGSRAVTKYLIVLSALSLVYDKKLDYVVRWSCTSSLDDSWHVFG